MDPRERAEAILARARARGAYVVTPDSAISPMDALATVQIPRRVVREADDPERTSVFAVADELPAIAQEATTQSLASPPRPGGQPSVPRQSVPQAEEVSGILPTTTQPGVDRSSLSRRLDGGF